MSIFDTLVKLALGKVDAANEKLTDANAIALLEQNIREAERKLGTAQAEVAKLAGRLSLAQENWSKLNEEYGRLSNSREQAQAQNRLDLVAKIDERMNTLDGEGASLRTQIESYEGAISGHRDTISYSQDQLRTLKQEIATVKVNDAVQRSQETLTVGVSGVGGSINSAADSLKRIQAKQAEKAAVLKAGAELNEAYSGKSLEKGLAAAGLIEGPRSGFTSGRPRPSGGFTSAPRLGTSPEPLGITQQDPASTGSDTQS